MFCTIEQVRNSSDKILDVVDVPDETIEGRIEHAEKIIIVNLSRLKSSAELRVLGASSTVLNLLAIYKSVELVLTKLYGAARQADQVSDIDYWKKKYNELLGSVLAGDVFLDEGDRVPVNKPVATPKWYKQKQLFRRKGIPGTGEGYIDE